MPRSSAVIAFSVIVVGVVYYLMRPVHVVHDPHTSAVLVTGASSGLGKHAAQELDRLGFTVFAGVRKDSDGATLREEGSSRMVPVILDVTKPAQIDAALDTIQAECSQRGVALIALVNNAGVAIPKAMAQATPEDMQWQYEVNVFGLVAVTNKFLPTLLSNRGRLVIIGSLGAIVTPPNHGLYTGTKASLEAIADALRREHDVLFPGQLSVSLLETGAITTPIVGKLSSMLDDHVTATKAACADEGFGSSGCKYAMMALAFGRLAEETTAGHPSVNTAAVVDAITSASPSERYLVGLDAQIFGRLVRWVPDRIVDAIARTVYTRKIGEIREEFAQELAFQAKGKATASASDEL